MTLDCGQQDRIEAPHSMNRYLLPDVETLFLNPPADGTASAVSKHGRFKLQSRHRCPQQTIPSPAPWP